MPLLITTLNAFSFSREYFDVCLIVILLVVHVTIFHKSYHFASTENKLIKCKCFLIVIQK